MRCIVMTVVLCGAVGALALAVLPNSDMQWFVLLAVCVGAAAGVAASITKCRPPKAADLAAWTDQEMTRYMRIRGVCIGIALGVMMIVREELRKPTPFWQHAASLAIAVIVSVLLLPLMERYGLRKRRDLAMASPEEAVSPEDAVD